MKSLQSLVLGLTVTLGGCTSLFKEKQDLQYYNNPAHQLTLAQPSPFSTHITYRRLADNDADCAEVVTELSDGNKIKWVYWDYDRDAIVDRLQLYKGVVLHLDYDGRNKEDASPFVLELLGSDVTKHYQGLIRTMSANIGRELSFQYSPQPSSATSSAVE